MKISLRNLSTVSALVPYLPHIADALTEQLISQFGPTWEQVFSPCDLVGPHDKPNNAVVTFYDTADQADELGDHELTNGLPTGRIFVKTILDGGGTLAEGSDSVSGCASHEACEIGGDPYANWWSEWPKKGDLVALETADPVEDESYSASNGVALSNFVTPRWFRQGSGPYDWLKTRKHAFEVSPGGYVILLNGGPVFGPQARKNRDHKHPRRVFRQLNASAPERDVPKAILPPQNGVFRPEAGRDYRAKNPDPTKKLIFLNGKYRWVKR